MQKGAVCWLVLFLTTNVMCLPSITGTNEEKPNNVIDSFRQTFGKRFDDFELVRSFLNIHKQRLSEELSHLPNVTVEDEGADTTDLDKEFQIPNRLKQYNEESTINNNDGYYHQSPEILNINHALKDYLYQGDIALTSQQAQLMFFKQRNRRQALNLETYPEFKWPNDIEYSIEQSFDDKNRMVIKEAIDFWQNHTCLTFKENKEAKLRINFFRGMGCWSFVGKVVEMEAQPISIGEGCEHFAVVTHEIAHALGFFHAQSRYDRDKFVRFNAQNVQAGFEDQFGKEGPEENNNYNVKYDYGSVLHYSDNAFTKKMGKRVLISTEPYNQNTMGQRIQPSFFDVLVMNKHYDCLGKCAEELKCEYGGYQNPKDCSKCICPWGFSGQTCNEVQPSNGEYVPENCSRVIEATTNWTKLEVKIGDTAKILRPQHSSCYIHIKAPKNKKVSIKILEVGPVCSSGCFFGNSEFKVSNDFGRTGHRMCCPSDIKTKPTLISKTNLAVVSIYTRLYLQRFKIEYKYGSFFFETFEALDNEKLF